MGGAEDVGARLAAAGAMRYEMKKTRVGDLYRLDFSNGKSYIGASSQGAVQRYHVHRQLAILKCSQHPIHKAWRKYGAPKLVILECDLDVEFLWKQKRKPLSNTGPGRHMDIITNLVGMYHQVCLGKNIP